MKKITFLFYLSFLPVFVSAQSAEDSVCRANIEKIFKVIDLKVKLDYLKLFKEFVFNDNLEILPDAVLAAVYLKCGCKIP